MKQPDEFKIPPVDFPDENQIVAKLQAVLEGRKDGSGEIVYAVPPEVIKTLADIATNVWRAENKMLDSCSREVRDGMKGVYRHIEAVLERFKEIGLEVKSHTGDPFDYGLPLKVVTTQPTPDIMKECVIETIKPTIFWHEQIIQMGEVVIATPASSTPPL
jgi:molecular chaperone GrpE (heat shock protein)